MIPHDVLTFASGLSARLATRSRHVGVFMGAGTSKACGLPDVNTLQAAISSRLEGENKSRFDALLRKHGLEQVLSRVRRIAALLEGEDRIDGLDADGANQLDAEVCRLIVSELSTAAVSVDPVTSFAAWVGRADYSRPIEVFTVNYDLLVEEALDRLGAPYFDGFVGSIRARFRSDLVEAGPDETHYVPSFFARVWKLHGSLNWEQEESGVVRLGRPVPDGAPAAIYPSDSKYEESRRVPFLVLQDRLRRSLYEPESLTLVTGYSWGDAHLNEPFFEATARRPRSEVIAFCYDTIPDDLAERATLSPNLQVVTKSEAILGGIRAPWKPPDDGVPDDIWRDEGLALGDFSALSSFLARASTSQSDTIRYSTQIMSSNSVSQ